MGRRVVAAVVLSALGACGTPVPPRPVGAAKVVAAMGTLPPGPPRGIDHLPIPPLDAPWAPPSSSAGDLAPLGEMLKGTRRIAVQLGPRLDGPIWRARVPAMLAALGIEAEVAMLPAATIAETIAGTFPLQRADGRSGAPPRWSTTGLAPSPKMRTPRSVEAGGDRLVLVLDDAPIDADAWRALPAAARGSCEAPLQALALGQEQSLAQLEPWLDHADAVLWQVYRAELAALLPAITDGLRGHASPKPPDDARDPKALREHECGHALWQWAQHYQRCADANQPCAVAPRMFLVGGAKIGAPEPSVYVPDGCAEIVGLDVVSRVRALGREAAEVAAQHLDEEWVVLADRLGAITEVHAALEDACEPRRRRFAESDLAEARGRLAKIGEALASAEPPRAGAWQFEPESFHVPGIGPVQSFASYDAGPGSPATTAVAESRALRQFVLSRAVCRGATSLPLAIALVDPGADAVRFFGYVYEEELACAELPPLTGAAP